MNQYQITSRVRHLRYICFIDGNYAYAALFSLMVGCQKNWGGRYTPIIPVYNNVIADGYLELIKHYDPDYVLCSAGVDVEVIKQLRCFNPAGYFELDDQGHCRDFEGVNAFHLLSEYTPGSKVLVSEGIANLQSPTLDFYKINFGLVMSTYVGDDEITRQYQKIELNTENFASLNQLIHEQKPILRSQLARRNLNTAILRASTHQPYNAVELVIARNTDSILDLLYYWNRQLFECRNVLYCTVEELTVLCQDRFIGGVLYDLSDYDYPIEVISQTLSEAEVEALITEVIRPIAFQRAFRYRAVSTFPFAVRDARGNSYSDRSAGEKSSTQTMISDTGLLQLPTPSFSKKLSFYPQEWAVDLEISQRIADHRNRIMFPLTTESGYVVKHFKGRIRWERELSIFVSSQRNGPVDATVEIPTFPSLLHQLVSTPVLHGNLTQTKFHELGPHDSSNRMAAFLSIFNHDYTLIEEFFDDKFWVTIFEKLCTSEALAGDAITFDDLVGECVATFRLNGVELEPRASSFRNEDNLRLGLRRTVQELCGYRALLPGFKLKCTHCSSIFWYHIKGVDEAVNCNGCLRDFAFPVEQPFAYKLNNLVKNNIYQSRTQRDGNLTVIRTLASLHARARKSFGYSSQVNLYDSFTAGRPCAELDIAGMVDGQFIIGEAKHSSSAFLENNSKSLRSLVDVAKEIYPDQVILACYEDKHGKLARAEQGLAHLFNQWKYKPKITTLLLHAPDYFSLSGYRYFYH